MVKEAEVQSSNYMKKAIIDNKDVITLNSAGLSSTKIAITLNTSIHNIRGILNDNKLNDNIYIKKFKSNEHLIDPIKELYQQGVSKKKIARDLNTYFKVVNDIIKNNNISNGVNEGSKRCCKCKKCLSLNDFGLDVNSKLNRRSICKLCRKNEPSRKEYCKKWASENKELKAKIDKEYGIKNKDKIKEYKKTEKYKLIKAKSYKKYYQKVMKIPEIKIAMRMRSMMSSYAKYKKIKTFDILGYSNIELVNHLESKFTKGMSWSNYGRGGWHIDHIRPLASFDKNDPNWITIAFSLDNLQPLYESENCSKGSLYNGIRYSINKKSSKK